MPKFEVLSIYINKGINIPKRSTKGSAGYDIEAAEDIVIKPQEIGNVPTGLKASFSSEQVLLLINRSSMALKRNLMLPNGIGVIDADYYNNPLNEGAISVILYNFGKEEVMIKKGERIAQAIFLNYLKTDDELAPLKDRKGGFGSSGK